MTPDYARAQLRPSPNFWLGRGGYDVRYIVMHGTAGDAQGSLAWLQNPQSVASVHYLVDRGGVVYQLVSEANAAWGNGIPEGESPFVNGPNPNLFTISIEHERDTQNTSPITPEQQAASTALVADIRRRHGNLPLIPHSAISPLSRAHCPGDGFPLEQIDAGSRYAPQKPVQRYVLRVDERLRPLPLLTCPRYGATLPRGTRVAAIPAPTGRPDQTAHWIYVRTSGDVQGYLLRANLAAV